jgi:hypothetical protein
MSSIIPVDPTRVKPHNQYQDAGSFGMSVDDESMSLSEESFSADSSSSDSSIMTFDSHEMSDEMSDDSSDFSIVTFSSDESSTEEKILEFIRESTKAVEYAVSVFSAVPDEILTNGSKHFIVNLYNFILILFVLIKNKDTIQVLQWSCGSVHFPIRWR